VESWMITLAGLIISFIGMIVIGKYKTEQNEKTIVEHKREFNDRMKKIEECSKEHDKEDVKVHGAIFAKIDKLSEEQAQHKVRLHNAPNMEQVRNEFVSKEMFAQMQKHMDEKIDSLGKSIEKSLGMVLSNQMDMASKLEKMKDR